MILVTGGTGFIGNVLIRHLTESGYPVKLLIRPSHQTPKLPKGVPFEVALTSLSDDKGLRAALKDVDTIIHLAGAESSGRKAELTSVDVKGTQALVQAASAAKIQRFVYLSHLGADRASAFPLLKAKGIAEQFIRASDVPHTIFRSAVAYGEIDHFTNGLAFILKISPYLSLLPEEGQVLLQPIWVEDLASVMTWSLEMQNMLGETVEIGGPEYLSFKKICEIITEQLNIKRRFISIKPVVLNRFTELLEILVPNFPTSVFWLDYLATNRTTNLDTLPRVYNLLPARMSHQLGYLRIKSFRRDWWRTILPRKRISKQWD